MANFWKRLECYWNDSPIFAWGLPIAGLLLVLWNTIRPQSPGVAIGMLALAAGIMSIRPTMHAAEKSAWVIVLIVFAILEVRAIRRSDEDNKAAREDQNKAFRVIADGLRESLLSTTGGDSYGFIVPMTDIQPPPFVYTPVSGFNLIIRNSGEAPLTGVVIHIARVESETPLRINGSFPNAISMQTVAGHAFGMLPGYLFPIPNEEGVDHYYSEISAQNGFVKEDIWFRRATSGISWAYKLKVSEQGIAGNPDRILRTVDWTEPKKRE